MKSYRLSVAPERGNAVFSKGEPSHVGSPKHMYLRVTVKKKLSKLLYIYIYTHICIYII